VRGWDPPNPFGYPLYITLLGGGVTGMGTGVLMLLRNLGSMYLVIPELQRNLAAISLICYLLFTQIVSYRMLFSSLKL